MKTAATGSLGTKKNKRKTSLQPKNRILNTESKYTQAKNNNDEIRYKRTIPVKKDELGIH
jgi:hypothetical protein